MISIVVPVYNVEKYITKCLESIVNQSYTDFELLLINDGSTDNSLDVIQKYLINTKINYRLINKENGGQSSSRNIGIKESKGEYIIFIDSDDVIKKDFLEKLFVSINEDDYDFSFSNFEYVKEQEPPTDNNDDVTKFNKKDLLETFLKRRINFVLPSMLVKKDFITNNNLYFDERIRFSEDQLYIWELIINSNKSIYLKEKMYGYFLREKSIMTASPYQKIMNGHNIFSEFTERLLTQYPDYKDIISMILPRWELGTLYTSAKLVTYEEYISMYKTFSGKTIFNRLINIKDRNAYLLAAVCSLSCKLLYELCRKMKLE